MTLKDQAARNRIRSDLDTTMIIEAAAGTGKTTALVSRIVAAVAAGRARLDRLVAVTFTEKAAGELKLRLRKDIETARRESGSEGAPRAFLDAALGQLEEARVGTIHAFCADLLREHPVEAGVDPAFQVANEEVATGLFDVAFERWFERVLDGPGEGVRRLLRRRDLADRDGPRPLIRALAEQLRQWRDFGAPWRHESFEREGEIDELVEELRALAELARQGPADNYLRKGIEEISAPVEEVMRLESVRGGRDYDALEAALVGLVRGDYMSRRWNWKGLSTDKFGEFGREQVAARRHTLRGRLERLCEAVGVNLAPLLRDELWPLIEDYERLKTRAGVLDFLDLLLVARNLVRDNAPVRAQLQERFTHILIDEFQDTDPLQAEILLLLACDDPAQADWRKARPVAGKLFIVGDPKQSIYRFRRADVALYQEVKRRLIEYGAALENLTVSFRATAELQEFVNAAIAPHMPAETDTQPAYLALEPLRDTPATQPSLVVLPVPEPYGERAIAERAIERSLPDAVAAFIKWLVERSGWTVTERERPQQRLPIKPRHICILFRRRLSGLGQDVTGPYTRALEARHLPHLLVKGASLSEREEVEALRNALLAIERPQDELAVFATLRGPFFALADGALLEFVETGGRLHPFAPFGDDLAPKLREVTDALGVLRELHRGRNRRPIAETISRLLGQTRAHAGIAIWPRGEQALANIMRVMDMARRYEARGGAISFRGFVEELEALGERDRSGETPVVEEGTEAVRMMTVHSAKGLEFPVVVLADLTCKETREPSRYLDAASGLCALRLAGCAPRQLVDHLEEERRRDEEEASRLLYVATTRARDLLVLPAVGDKEMEGWLRRLNQAIYPEPQLRRTPITSNPAGCPQFGGDSALARPEWMRLGAQLSVAPGLHRARTGRHCLVWWDPRTLKLDVSESMGLRQLKLLQTDESGERSERAERRHEQWVAERRDVLQAGAAPSLTVVAATQLAAEALGPRSDGAALIAIQQAHRRPLRPHGLRFGTLVHTTLLRVALTAEREEIARATMLQARILGAPPEEIEAAVEAVDQALRAPVMVAAGRPEACCQKECPLGVTLEDGTVVEGIADLVFTEQHNGCPRWVVMDFKTDLDIAPRLDQYQAQLALYMRAVTESTKAAARGVILWV